MNSLLFRDDWNLLDIYKSKPSKCNLNKLEPINDEIVPDSTKVSNFNQDQRIAYLLKDHPYTSHISKFALFPNYDTLYSPINAIHWYNSFNRGCNYISCIQKTYGNDCRIEVIPNSIGYLPKNLDSYSQNSITHISDSIHYQKKNIYKTSKNLYDDDFIYKTYQEKLDKKSNSIHDYLSEEHVFPVKGRKARQRRKENRCSCSCHTQIYSTCGVGTLNFEKNINSEILNKCETCSCFEKKSHLISDKSLNDIQNKFSKTNCYAEFNAKFESKTKNLYDNVYTGRKRYFFGRHSQQLRGLYQK